MLTQTMQSRTYKRGLMALLSILVIVNIVGIALPAWYHTEQKHRTNFSSTNDTSAPSSHPTSVSNNLQDNNKTGSRLVNVSDSSQLTYSHTISQISAKPHQDTWTADNATVKVSSTLISEESPETDPPWDCEIHVHIQEGLWQRYCIETHREGIYCVLDVQEWCHNLEFSDFNSFVLALQIVGDFILVLVLVTVVYSQRKKQDFDLETAAVGVGTAGIFMLLGVLVYAAADTGELTYRATDLHAGWGLCVTGGGACLCLAVHCMYRHVNDRQPSAQLGYYPIYDEDDEILQDNCGTNLEQTSYPTAGLLSHLGQG